MSKNNSKKQGKAIKNQVIFGFHSVLAALINEKRIKNELILQENTAFPVENFKSKINKIKYFDKKKFRKLFGNDQTTQGIVLNTEELNIPSIEEFLQNEKNNNKSVIVVLDQITDPQNIGSIMRSCALFNCKAIVVSKNNSPELTPALLKAASGAAELVNYFKVTNIRRSLQDFKQNGYWIYGFDSSSNSKTNLNFEKKSVLVFGSEGKGIRELIKKECDFFIRLKIENISKFQIDSLNVSNATSIALYEFYKK
jgi:23S rRNA (guanosine2251-2'-O)-methyltransferase